MGIDWNEDLIGTGGFLPGSLGEQVTSRNPYGDCHGVTYIYSAGTGGYVLRQPVRRILSPEKQIVAIKDVLSLNMSELARVLRVERPTVYAWIDSAHPQPANLKRIASVYEIVRWWKQFSLDPIGDPVRVPVYGDQSLLDLLSQEELDEQLIEEVLSALAVSDRRLPQYRGNRNTPATLAMKHGFKSVAGDRAYDSVSSAIRHVKRPR